MPKALFVNGNSSDNIRNGSALYSDKDKMITQAIFGNGPKYFTEAAQKLHFIFVWSSL